MSEFPALLRNHRYVIKEKLFWNKSTVQFCTLYILNINNISAFFLCADDVRRCTIWSAEREQWSLAFAYPWSVEGVYSYKTRVMVMLQRHHYQTPLPSYRYVAHLDKAEPPRVRVDKDVEKSHTNEEREEHLQGFYGQRSQDI